MKRFMSYPWQKILVNIGGIAKEVQKKVMKGTNFELAIENLKKS
jgi:hypothetical protein